MINFTVNKIVLTLALTIVTLQGCSKKSLSDRDARREQIRSRADAKRTELKLVAGQYGGLFLQPSDGPSQDVALNLEVKDVPHSEDGEVDQVNVPELKGSLRFPLGENASSEFVGFGTDKAEFDSKQSTLDVVVKNDVYGEIVLSLTKSNDTLEGHWTAPTLGYSGTTKLRGPNPQLTALTNPPIKGTYRGQVTNIHPQTHLPERALVTIHTAQNLNDPKGISVSGSLRFYLGSFESLEYIDLPFSEFDYNFFSRKIMAKTSGEYKLTMIAHFDAGSLNGTLHSDSLGEIGRLEAKRQ